MAAYEIFCEKQLHRVTMGLEGGVSSLVDDAGRRAVFNAPWF